MYCLVYLGVIFLYWIAKNGLYAVIVHGGFRGTAKSLGGKIAVRARYSGSLSKLLKALSGETTSLPSGKV